MVRAIRTHQQGPADGAGVFVVEDIEVPPPGPGEVRVRHTAMGVNFIDVYQRKGVYALQTPATLGFEAAGVVVAVGPGVTHLSPGDRVGYYWRVPGAYCDERNVPAARLVALPKEVADDVVASLFLKGLTAEYLLRRTFRVDARHTIVVHAAAGGVGQLLCQWAAALGARVIGVVSSDEKARVALNAGAHHVLTVPHGAADLAKRVRALCEDGVDVVYDSVGKDTFDQSLDMLKHRGMLVLFGQSSGVVPPFSPSLLSQKGSLFLTRPSLHDYVHDPGEYRAAADALFDMLKKGALKPRIHAVYALADVGRAHAALESRTTTGSLVLVP